MSDFQLVKENPDHFLVRHPNGATFPVAKAAVDDSIHEKLRKLPKIKGYQEGGDVTPEPEIAMAPREMDTFGAQENRSLPPPSETPDVQPQAQPAAAPMQAPNPAPYGVDLGGMENAYQLQLQGIQQGTKATVQGAEQQAAAEQKYLQQVQDSQQEYAKRRADLDAEHKDLFQGVQNSTIDPNRWWEQQTGAKGVGKRVLALIGYVLGGGAQMRTGTNPTGQAINELIQRDIDSQKESLNTKKSLLSDNLNRYGDLRQAELATNMQMHTVLQAQLGKIAAQTQGGMAKANALQAMSALQQTIIQQKMAMAGMAARAAFYGGQGDQNQQAQMFPYLDEKEQKLMVHLPSGQYIPAHDEEDAKNLKDAVQGKLELDQVAKDMNNFMDTTGRGFIPYGETRGAGEALQARAELAIHKIVSGIRANEATGKYLSNLIPNPADIRQDRARAKLVQLIKTAQDNYDSALGTRAVGQSPQLVKQKFVPSGGRIQ